MQLDREGRGTRIHVKGVNLMMNSRAHSWGVLIVAVVLAALTAASRAQQAQSQVLLGTETAPWQENVEVSSFEAQVAASGEVRISNRLSFALVVTDGSQRIISVVKPHTTAAVPVALCGRTGVIGLGRSTLEPPTMATCKAGRFLIVRFKSELPDGAGAQQ